MLARVVSNPDVNDIDAFSFWDIAPWIYDHRPNGKLPLLIRKLFMICRHKIDAGIRKGRGTTINVRVVHLDFESPLPEYVGEQGCGTAHRQIGFSFKRPAIDADGLFFITTGPVMVFA